MLNLIAIKLLYSIPWVNFDSSLVGDCVDDDCVYESFSFCFLVVKGVVD